MPPVVCPKCASTNVSRVRRQGFLQNLIYPRLGKFPWLCGDCNNEYYSPARGKRKRRKTVEDNQVPPHLRPGDTT